LAASSTAIVVHPFANGPTPHPDSAADVQAFREAVHSLPVDQRACWVLRDLHQLTYPQIASAVRIPRRAVRSRVAQARNYLAKQTATLTTANDVSDTDELVNPLGATVDTHGTIVDDLEEEVRNLRIAVEHRGRIGIAVGVIMTEHRVGPEQAFELLREGSHSTTTHCSTSPKWSSVSGTSSQCPYEAPLAQPSREGSDVARRRGPAKPDREDGDATFSAVMSRLQVPGRRTERTSPARALADDGTEPVTGRPRPPARRMRQLVVQTT
jgi:hypothetical protein